jgi:hypothetical protein
MTSLADRVCEISTSLGTGAFTLGGAANASLRRFSDAFAVTDTPYYLIQAIDTYGIPTGQWELGQCTSYGGGATLARSVVIGNSDGTTSPVNFASGIKHVYNTMPASYVSGVSGLTQAQVPLYDLTPYARFTSLDGAPWVRGTSAGPHAVQDRAGNWWQIDVSGGYAHANWFGADPSGVADSAAALNAASTALGNIGGGRLDITGGKYLVTSADFVLQPRVQLYGPYLNIGEEMPAVYSTVKSSLWISSTYTLRMYAASGVTGIAILRYGLTDPAATNRARMDGVKLFAGTGITIGDGASQASLGIGGDVYIGHVFIMGFAQGIYSYYNDRMRIEYVHGDCTNGIRIATMADLLQIRGCHWWPFYGSHTGAGAMSYTVTNATNNGAGLIRLTIGTHDFVAGDTVVVNGMTTGTTEATGRWIVATAGATYIDLTGSAFTHTYTSGGAAWIVPSIRAGNGIWFESGVDFGHAEDCSVYGYDIGFLSDGASDTKWVNCVSDAYPDCSDPTTAAFKFQANSQNGTMIGCDALSHGYGVQYDPGVGANASAQSVVKMVGCGFWTNSLAHAYLVYGKLTIDGCQFRNLTGDGATTNPAILVEKQSYGIMAANCRCVLTQTALAFQGSGQALERSFISPTNDWVDVQANGIGTRFRFDNSNRNLTYSAYGSSSGVAHIQRNARGTAGSPTATQASDILASFKAQAYDGSAFSDAASIRSIADATATAGSTPGRLIMSTTASGAATLTDRFTLDASGNLKPVTDNAYSMGITGQRLSAVWAANGTIQTSDERAKDAAGSVPGLDFLSLIEPRSYVWKVGGRRAVRQVYHDADGNEIQEGLPLPHDAVAGDVICEDIPGKRTHWGLYAQDVKAALDHLGLDFGGWGLEDAGDPGSQQWVNYSEFVAPLIMAVKELDGKVKALSSEIDRLKAA